MSNISTSDSPCKENGNAISQWKIDLVGTFFHKKQEKPDARKQPLVFEDCDISSICVSNDDTTENSYDDHEGTLTSSPVCKTLPQSSSLGRVIAYSCDGNSESKVDELNNQKTSNDELSVNNQTDFLDSKIDVENLRNKQEVLPGNHFALEMASVSSSTGVSVESQVIITRPQLLLKSSVILSVPTTSASSSVAPPEISAVPMSSSNVTSDLTTVKPSVPSSQTQIINDTSDPSEPESISSALSVLTRDYRGPESKSSLVQESPSKLRYVVPSSAGLATNSKPISTFQDGNKAPPTSPSEEMNIPSVRPILFSKSTPAPKLTDQGRNCVSVILKSSRLDPKAARLNTIANRQEKVEQLVSRYSLKFGHKSSPGVQVRLDYCFNKPAEARQFFIAVHDLEESKSPPKFLSCFLLSEIDLGYKHEPVLTEYDLLAIQSPSYCRNVFRTPILIKVVQEGEMVSLKFKTVADVNRFLFNKSGSKTIRSLGQLRMNPVHNKMIPDQDGLYSLFTEERQISQKFGDKHKFTMIPKMEYGEDASLLGGNLLLFSTKLDLFKFLFSEDAAELDHLQFLKSKVVNCPDPKKMVEKDVMNSSKISEDIGGYETDRKIKVEIKGNGVQQEGKKKVPSKCSEEISINQNGDGVDVKISVKDEIWGNCLHNKGSIQLEAAEKVPYGLKHDALPLSGVDRSETLNVKICPEKVAINFTPPRCIESSDQLLLTEGKELEKVPSQIPSVMKSDETGKEDVSSIKLVLSQKDDEIIRLKGKLLAKEKMIETEIRNKNAVKSELKEASMQLEKIHNLSLTLHGKLASGN